MATSITTIQSTDLITNSRADINNNFDSLLVNKIETDVITTDSTFAAASDSKLPSQLAVKQYVDAGGNVNASTTAKGIVEEATQAEVDAGSAVGGTGARLFVNPSTMPLPHSINLFNGSATTSNNLRYSDKLATTSGTTNVAVNVQNVNTGVVLLSNLLAAADNSTSTVILGEYLYLMFYDTTTTPNTHYVYRVNLSDLSTNVAMTFSGAVTLAQTDQAIEMTSDGTYFYFSFQAGNSANSYVISKYSVSGTTFTYVGDVTLGSTAIWEYAVRQNGTFIAHTTSNELKKYDSSGTVTETKAGFFGGSSDEMMNIADTIYVINSSFAGGFKVYP